MSGPVRGMLAGVDGPQRAAYAHVRARARPGAPATPADRVVLHLHPDRDDLLGALARDGAYLSQFVTGTGNGGRTAYPGGDRWRWESRMFGGAYDGAAPGLRPVYGALHDGRRRCGAAPRFGSSHLRLAPHVLRRATFCWPDSVGEPEDVATAEHVGRLRVLAAAHPPSDPIDDYVEAQVHGTVRIPDDAEALVLDPSFRGTAVEVAAGVLGVTVEWHGGAVLDAAGLDPGYRGADVTALGAVIARDGVLDARVVGDAARTGRCDPQQLKRVWHHLARELVTTGA